MLILVDLDIPDISRFSRTCRTIHHNAMAHLVNASSEKMTPQKFFNFCDFLCVDVSRILLLYTLHIPVGSAEKDQVDNICKILDNAQNLQSLSIWKCEELLTLDERISSAIASLPKLTALTLRESSTRVTNLVVKLQCPIQELSITCWLNESDPEYIANASATGYQHWYPVPYTQSVLETVHTLTLQSCGSINPVVPLFYTFPNLRRLRISINNTYSRDLPIRSREASREANSNEQRDTMVHHWQELQELIGTCYDLYALALSCHVQYLNIVGFVVSAGHMSRICTGCRPKALTADFISFNDTLDIVNRGARPSGVLEQPNLQCVTTTIDIARRQITADDNTDYARLHVDTVNVLRHFFRKSSIQELNLSVMSSRPISAAKNPMIQYLTSLEPEEFVRLISEEIPSLQKMALNIRLSWKDYRKSYWRVHKRVGKNVEAEKLDKPFKSLVST
ncbi:hypothetical protein C8Q75DRAFT_788901 [Abortiporus biennis]|nr:hypothetical protein C8Q75DRAFT_788901 [Abortiporus biennis]